jgi:hypothetical protein
MMDAMGLLASEGEQPEKNPLEKSSPSTAAKDARFDGVSLLPIFRSLYAPSYTPAAAKQVAAELKPYALSQYMRCPKDTTNSSLFWKDNACLMSDRYVRHYGTHCTALYCPHCTHCTRFF